MAKANHGSIFAGANRYTSAWASIELTKIQVVHRVPNMAAIRVARRLPRFAAMAPRNNIALIVAIVPTNPADTIAHA
ncbi:hypothetical protein [Mycolicibacterium llatzerense]|uniref:hypothetical protein n=1 Tax=Mycolicibacterium llatzerense TaxID=280871 RepID=UPI0021B5C8B3|nr:hypothetical protein [Mycolicibacterium llatzerense]